MATSGTYAFSMDIDEVIQEASEMIGGEQTGGNEPKSARRSINLLLNDWQNRGINLWSVDTTAVTVTTSVTSFNMSSETLDVLEGVIRRTANGTPSDLTLTRISMQEYLQLPNKSQTGRPSQFAVRSSNHAGTPTVFLWPIPENSTDEIHFERIKYLEDVDKSDTQTPDISRRFYPALAVGLAYEMGVKRPGVDTERLAMLKTDYEAKLLRAMEEDRERVSMFFRPKLSPI
tara:strand:- start:1364 stop:2056 length:693 start_codon:yes stop_codon:yes gene_type:complete